MSITSALKKLAKNVFNVDTTGNNVDEILYDIANNASSSGGGAPVFHYTEDPVASADMYAFVMANKDNPFYIYDDELGLVRTIVRCGIYSENNFDVCVLEFDGAVLHLYQYRPDSEYPENVSRGDYAVWEIQV